MKIYRLAHQLAQRFGFMDNTELSELNTAAETEYNKWVSAARNVDYDNGQVLLWNTEHARDEGFKPRTLKQHTFNNKLALFFEKWWVRYLIVGAFIWLVPTIRRFMNDDPLKNTESSGPDDLIRWYLKQKYNDKL